MFKVSKALRNTLARTRNHSAKHTPNKTDFVLVDQPDIPAFITGKEREKMVKAFEEEAIRKIDSSKDEDYKIKFFERWKKDREKEGKPLTSREEKYYKSLRDEGRVYEFFVVLLPMGIFFSLRKEMGESSALLISLGVGVFMRWLCSL